MPRVLNAKQAAAAVTRSETKTTGIPEPGQPFLLFCVARSNQSILVDFGNEGQLSTPLVGPEPIEHWTLVADPEEDGTFHVKHVESGKLVLDKPGERLRVGYQTDEIVSVRISEAGNGEYNIKAPNDDSLWTFVPMRPFPYIVYAESNGEPEQRWRFQLVDDDE